MVDLSYVEGPGSRLGRVKQWSTEIVDYDVDYSEWLEPAVVIVSTSVVVYPADDQTIQASGLEFSGQKSTFRVAGGVMGHVYTLMFTSICSDQQVLTSELEVYIRDMKPSVVPPGTPAYVLKSGDTMTGALTLPGNAEQPLQAVPLQQLNSAISSISLVPGPPGPPGSGGGTPGGVNGDIQFNDGGEFGGVQPNGQARPVMSYGAQDVSFDYNFSIDSPKVIPDFYAECNSIFGTKDGVKRWKLQLGNAQAENPDPDIDTGSDFALSFYYDDGSEGYDLITIPRSTGYINLRAYVNANGLTVYGNADFQYNVRFRNNPTFDKTLDLTGPPVTKTWDNPGGPVGGSMLVHGVSNFNNTVSINGNMPNMPSLSVNSGLFVAAGGEGAAIQNGSLHMNRAGGWQFIRFGTGGDFRYPYVNNSFASWFDVGTELDAFIIRTYKTGGGSTTSLAIDRATGAVSIGSLSVSSINGPVGGTAPSTGAFTNLSASGTVSGAGFTNLLAPYAPKASPALTGVPTAPTATAGTNTTQLATTAFVAAAVTASTSGVSTFNTRTGAVTLTNADVTAVLPAGVTAPAMNGAASAGAATTWSKSDHVHPVDTSRYAASNPADYQTATQVAVSLYGYAPLASPALTGVPTAPTALTADNSTTLATTAFVKAQGYSAGPFGTMASQGANSVTITGGTINGTSVGATTASTGAFTTLAASGTLSGAGFTALVAPYAPLASAALTGVPTAPTATAGTSTTQLATTAFVNTAFLGLGLGTMANQNATGVAITGGAINGTTVGAATASTGAFTTLAVSGAISGAGVTSLLAPYAPLASPVFTGAPSLPTGTTAVTQAAADSSTKLATTEFVTAAVTGSTSGVSSFNTRAGAVTLLNADVIAVLPAGVTTPTMNGTGAAGAATTWSKSDHVHPTDTSRYATSNPAGYQTAAQVTAALGSYALTSAVPVASTTNPLMSGTVAVGVGTTWARNDHVHPTDTSRYAANNPSGYQTAAQVTATLAPYALTSAVPVASSTNPLMNGAVAVGAGTTWARNDHVHPVDTSRYAASNPSGYQTAAQVTATLAPYALTSAVPVASSTNPLMNGAVAVGAGTTWARNDHVHPVDTSRVAKSGDTMTGSLTISHADYPSINVNTTDPGTSPSYTLTAEDNPYFGMGLSAPSQDFVVSRYDATPDWNVLSNPLVISHADGSTTLKGATAHIEFTNPSSGMFVGGDQWPGIYLHGTDGTSPGISFGNGPADTYKILWEIWPDDPVALGGTGDLGILRFDGTTDTLLDKPLKISHATGAVSFTAIPTAPTAATADNSTQLATTAFVKAQGYSTSGGGGGSYDPAAVAITGGTINGTSVGATTPSTGKFTTLSASSTVSGAGFTTLLAPYATTASLGTMSTQNANAVAITGGAINGTTIGATTPSSGEFTGLRASPWFVVTAVDNATTSWAGMELDTNGAAQIFATKLSSGLGWSINLLDTSNFTDFSISRYNSSAALIDKPITISQATGVTAFIATPTAPTAATADSSTKLATTAFVKAQAYATTASLGTMSTQNATAVAITGGAINGTTIGATTAAAGTFTNLTASGTVSGAGFTTLLSTYAKIDSQAFTGTPSLPTGTTAVTQTAGDSSTKLATTAFVAASNTAQNLGTMATQNANAVAITGGAINGTTIGATTPSTSRFTTALVSPIAGQAPIVVAGSTPNFQQIGNSVSANTTYFGAHNSTGAFGRTVYSLSRGADPATRLAVANNDEWRTIFYGDDGTNLNIFASISAYVNGTPSTGIVPGGFRFNTATTAGVSTLALTIDSSQNTTFAGKMVALPSAAAKAGLGLGQGAAPTTPANGDVWITSAGLFYQANSATVGPNGTGNAVMTTGSTGVSHTNALTIAGAASQNAALFLNKLAGGFETTIVSQTGGLSRWSMQLGDNVAEGGSNAGSNFALRRCNDAGALIDAPFQILRNSGQAYFSQAINAQGGVIIQYADPVILMNKSGTGHANNIYGQSNSAVRWAISLGDGAAESTGNAGSDFDIARFNDAGAAIDNVFTINRASGLATFSKTLTSGNHTINGAASSVAALYLNKPASGQQSTIYGQNNGLQRWGLALGDASAESTGNLGSNLGVNRYNDAGTFVDAPIQIARSNGVTTFSQPIVNGSDIALKENVSSITDALAKVLRLDGVAYNQRGSKRRDIGLVAQAVKKVVPEVVFNVPSPTDPDKEILGIAYSQLVGLLINAVKELNDKVEALESRS